MHSSLYAEELDSRSSARSLRRVDGVRWRQGLPKAWRDRVIAPLWFDVFREYEMAADRAVGYDEDAQPCFCSHRHILSEIRSDDDEVYYSTPVHAETLASWRLRDGRWLILRSMFRNFEAGAVHSFFSFGSSMPR